VPHELSHGVSLVHLDTESRNTYVNHKHNITAIASDSPSPIPPREKKEKRGEKTPSLNFSEQKLIKSHHAQSLLVPLFHDAKTPHVLISRI